MSLLLRVNLALVVVFAVATITGLACRSLLERNAEHEIRGNAELMMDSALAAREYTAGDIEPLLRTQMRGQFLGRTSPSDAPPSAATLQRLETELAPRPGRYGARRQALRART